MQWSQLGKPSPLQLVELGPGRGTLIADIVRVSRSTVPLKFGTHILYHV